MSFLSSIRWWGWVLIGLGVALIAILKITVFNKIKQSRNKTHPDD